MKGILIATLLICLASYQENDSAVDASAPSGVYEFTSLDSTGAIKERGTLDIDVKADSVLTADLRLDKGEPVYLAGSLKDGAVLLDLNNGCLSCIYFLEGKISGSEIKGTWSRGHIRVEEKGTFVARRL